MPISRGFTLLEVVVALLIVALALAAAVQLTASGADNLSAMTRKTEAHWVAMNQLAELRARGAYPAIGKSQGKSEEAGHDWHWSQDVSQGPVRGLRKIAIQVRAGEKSPVLATVRGFIGQVEAAAVAPRAVSSSGIPAPVHR